MSFRPHVGPEESPPELTLRSLILGALCGVVFGAASVYLALKVGLTVSASVPIAVIAIALLRPRGGKRAILEHNIVQTVGSAGESVAAAVVFTVPALLFLGYPLEVGLTTLIALTGGMLGVLLMVPLRRYLIVKEHGQLRYPEGKACAEILVAGEKGGTSAKKVFVGMGIGAAFKAFQAILGGVKGSLHTSLPFFKGASMGCDVEPPLLGVGYIIGYRTSLMMVAGSLLASFVLVPMIALFGAQLPSVLPPGTKLISEMSAMEIWSGYVKHIGAGAVATGGIFGLVRALPSIVASIRASARSLLGGGGAQSGAERTDRDTPTPILALGSLAIVAFLVLVPAFHVNVVGAVLILGLGFLFAVVSSRITGEVGSSSCPLSGMTIGVLMATCGAFLLVGWEGSSYARLALMIGAVVCIAISNAGTCSQDLKTGFLVGATPVRQQGALLAGVLASVLAIGWTTYGLNLAETEEHKLSKPFAVDAALIARADEVKAMHDASVKYRFVRLTAEAVPAEATISRKLKERDASGAEKEVSRDVKAGAGNYLVDETTREARYLREDGIGSGRLQAPQAKLMSVVIDGLLTHNLPWDLILIGAAIAIFIELMGFRSLTFAVGVYLPLASTMPVYLGGLVRLLSDKLRKRELDAEDEPEGVLWCSGLIAGASIVGILSAMLAFVPGFDSDSGLHPQFALLTGIGGLFDGLLGSHGSDLWGAAVLGTLCWLIYRGAAKSRS